MRNFLRRLLGTSSICYCFWQFYPYFRNWF